MQRSETLTELAPALRKLQAAMRPAELNKTNPHFKSKYADLSSVWECVRNALNETGLSVAQSFEENGDGITITTTLLHDSGEYLSGSLSLPYDRGGGVQGAGSAITYGRRYGLAAMLGIVVDEDDDGNRGQGSSQKTSGGSGTGPISDAQVRLLNVEVQKRDIDRDAFHTYCGVSSFKDIKKEDFDKFLTAARRRPEKKPQEPDDHADQTDLPF